MDRRTPFDSNFNCVTCRASGWRDFHNLTKKACTLPKWHRYRGGARGELGGYSPPPPSEASSPPPPVGGNFGFSSEEIWQNNAWKHHFSVILASLSEASAPLSENFWRHPCTGMHVWIPESNGEEHNLLRSHSVKGNQTSVVKLRRNL